MNRKARLSVIAADFNRSIVDPMIDAVVSEAAELRAEVVEILRVPGCYEVPIIAHREVRREDVDGLVVLGYIEKGETQHGEVMGHVVHGALVDLEMRHGKPIGIGIIGPGATPEQAALRTPAYGISAIRAVMAVMRLLHP